MTTVQATTDQVPELTEVLARRRAQGIDTYDEWWEGVYRIVTGPTPEHGMVAVRIGAFLDALTKGTDLRVSAPVNIGVDGEDARVPDLGVFGADTPRTSPAFLRTAALVVAVLSRSEVAGAKLDFYARWQVEEYLEVDLGQQTVRLLRHEGSRWQPATDSQVLPFSIESGTLVAASRRYRIDWPADL